MIQSRQRVVRCTIVLIACAVAVVTAAEFDLSWWTVDGGGATRMTGGSFTLSGTIGQPDATPAAMTGGNYALIGGFWPGFLPGCTSFARVDFDRDCDVDPADYSVFESCFSAPTVAHKGTPSCQTADLDADKDVDQADFGIFQRCYSGAGIPADPDCVDGPPSSRR